MKKKMASWLNLLLAAVFGLTIALAGSSPNVATNLLPHVNGQAAISQEKIQAAYGKLPLSFEVNHGQTDAQVKFLSKGSGYNLFLTPTEAVFTLSKPQSKVSDVSHHPGIKRQPVAKSSNTVLRMQLLGSNSNPQVIGLEPLPGKVNYFLGNDPKQWHTNIPTYAKVQYQQVYPGVDMVYYGNQRQLEYDFAIAPGTDPNTIKLAILGADNMEVDAQENLVLQTAGGQIQFHKPLVYQEQDGVRQAIKGGYVLSDQHLVSFRVESYDTSRPLIIDPVLAYSTYLGGIDYEFSRGIAVDYKGNAYVTGSTRSFFDFPTKNALQPAFSGGMFDAFVAKLNAEGSALVYSTFLGGSNNSDNSDGGITIAVDAKGNAYVTGFTNSTDFPIKNALQPSFNLGLFRGIDIYDAFVAKLNPEGSALVYSTFLGGSGDESSNGLALDVKGNVYVTGTTDSTDFPTRNPLQSALGGSSDAFVAKLNSFGSALVYSTYLGGGSQTDSNQGVDSSGGIAVDAKGNAYITGYTNSTNFPTTKNAFQPTLQSTPVSGSVDAFVAKLNYEGSALIYSTYLGGNDSESGNGIAVDAKGNAYITGYTHSTNFPAKNALQPTLISDKDFDFTPTDAFVSKLNPEGSALVYSTYLGSKGPINGYSIAVDTKGNVYVTGSGCSFPIKNPLQPTPDYGGAFVSQLNRQGSAFIYSTCLGPSDGTTSIAIDFQGNAYVTGYTNSSNFPTTKNALQPNLAISMNPNAAMRPDAFVTKIAP